MDVISYIFYLNDHPLNIIVVCNFFTITVDIP